MADRFKMDAYFHGHDGVRLLRSAGEIPKDKRAFRKVFFNSDKRITGNPFQVLGFSVEDLGGVADKIQILSAKPSALYQPSSPTRGPFGMATRMYSQSRYCD